MKVIAQNGTPINSVTPEEVQQTKDALEDQIENIQVTPDHLAGFSSDVMKVLTSADQDAIRKAAGITDEQIAVKGDAGETPQLQVSDSELQTKLPSQNSWVNLFDLSSLKGKDAAPAKDGADGTGIASITTDYQLSDSGSVVPDSQWSSSPPSPQQASFLWTRLTVSLTDDSSQVAYTVARSGMDGIDGEPGDTGNGITSSDIKYQSSESGQAIPTGVWGQSPMAEKGKYLWVRNTLAMSDGTQAVSYAVSYSAVDGVDGKAGETGATGTPGKNGSDGKSAYQLATDAGYSGTQEQWVASLAGKAGKDGTNGTNATTTAVATKTTDGLMSSSDKTKLDGLSAPVSPTSTAVASGTRQIGTSFTLSSTRNARVSYTIQYTLTAAPTLGQNLTVICTVDGAEVARLVDGILLGLVGTVNKTEVMTFDVPAGKSVLFTKSGTAGITVTIISGQETLM